VTIFKFCIFTYLLTYLFREFRVTFVQSVTLRWTRPTLTTTELGEPCPVLKYVIRLRQHGVRKSRAWKLEPDRLSVSLHDLRAETEYQVWLFTLVVLMSVDN